MQFSFLNLDFTLFCLGLWILRFDDFSLELIFFKLDWITFVQKFVDFLISVFFFLNMTLS